MAKNRSIFRVRGNLGDVNFFESDGKSYVRMATSIDKKRIMNAPEFKRTRENMSEFGASATIGKAFRTGFASVISNMGDRKMVGNMTKVCRAIVGRGKGKRGQRGFELLPNKDILKGVEFNSKEPFDGVFYAPHTVTTNPGRNEVLITIPDFNADHYVGVPKGATHFKLINIVAVLSDYQHNSSTKKYEPVNVAIDKENAMDASGYLPVTGMVGAVTTLTATLPGSPILPLTAGLVACFGIEFYQFLNGDYYVFAQDNAMKVVDVF